MSKSKFFGPGAYEELNGTTVHLTSSFEKPSFSATAYATALSNPLPFVGSSSSKYGGNAGLSVPTVSWPDLTRSSRSLGHRSASDPGCGSEPELALVEPPPLSSSPPQAATSSADASATSMSTARRVLMRGMRESPWVSSPGERDKSNADRP